MKITYDVNAIRAIRTELEVGLYEAKRIWLKRMLQEKINKLPDSDYKTIFQFLLELH